MPRVISPPRTELDALRQPLEPGERQVLEFFDAHLPEEWEIYVQPHLNGLRPDFVLLHPRIGIAVFEVKDWNLNAFKRWIDNPPEGAPTLKGCKDGKTFSLQRDNPVDKVLHYKDEIHNLYCPRLGEKVAYGVITAGIIFPAADDQEALDLLTPSLKYKDRASDARIYPVSGRHALVRGDLQAVFPEAARSYSKFMTPEKAADLRMWLVEPDAPKDQRTPLAMDEAQKALATSRTETGYRRIKGPAGSGKSIVLAARAAQLIAEGKDVLVATFNITLINYLADLAVRNNRAARKSGTWLNFHFWCKRVCAEAGRGDDYSKLWHGAGGPPDEVLSWQLPNLVSEILDGPDGAAIQKYDAILVDEGQDYLPNWWNLLRKVCRPGGEMLLVADLTQDVYERGGSWTDAAMTGAGFTGRWAFLEESYRLPYSLIEPVREFGRRFLPGEQVDLPPARQGELDLYPCAQRWVQVGPQQVAARAVEEIWRTLKTNEDNGFSVSDTTVLVDSQHLGEQIEAQLAGKGVKCITTFTEDPHEERRKKLSFFMGDARIKMTTFHSFKGWEARALILCLDHALETKDRTLLYIGMTRTKRHELGSFLTVVSSEPSLDGYGRTWPDYVVGPMETPFRVQITSEPTAKYENKTPDSLAFPAGARVRSRRWGVGTVLSSAHNQSNSVCFIRFDEGGEKQILASYLELVAI